MSFSGRKPADEKSRCGFGLWIIVFKRKGKRVYLLTNVYDPAQVSRRMAGGFYLARWGIEVEYRGLKQTLGRRKVLARTPEPGEMELAANISGMALLLLYAALVLGAKALRAIEALRHGESCAWLLRWFREALGDEYKRHSSKRARDWLHKKNERPPGPAKLRRLLMSEKARIRVLLMNHNTALC